MAPIKQKIMYMNRVIYLLAVIALLMSCSKGEYENPDVVGLENLNSFASLDDFLKASNDIESDDLKEFCSTNIPNSYILAENNYMSDDLYESMDKSELAYFNPDGYVLINDSIYFLSNNSVYKVGLDQQDKIEKIRNNKLNADPIIIYSLTFITPDILKSTSIGSGGLDARHQKEFNQKYYYAKKVEGLRKYVHEIYCQTTRRYLGPGVWLANSKVYLRVKLEYKGSGGWKSAGEDREIKVHVGYTCHLGNTAIDISDYLNEDISKSNDKTFKLVDFSGPVYTDVNWMVTMSGTIYQKVIGDIPSNGWTNSAVW